MTFSELAEYFQKIEATSSRVEITQQLAELFKRLSPGEARDVAYLLQGKIAPSFEKKEFGMAERMVVRAVVSALQLDKTTFENKLKTIGDIGTAVEDFKKQISSFEEREMSIEEVFTELKKITEAGGGGSQDVKVAILSSLIRQLDALSTRYIARIPLAALRLGFSDMTILDGLSWMVTGDKSLRTPIEQAYHVRPDLGFIAYTMKKDGVEGIRLVKPVVGTPIIMMRAERLSSGEEIIKQIGPSLVESKYDGFRLQVHYSKKKGIMKMFTRGLEDSAEMYPDIVAGIEKEITADEVIMEGEAIGFDSNTGSFLPFQQTSQRKRKYDIEETAKAIPLKLFAFELLYVNGENFIPQIFTERRKKLESIVENTGDNFKDTIIVSSTELIEDPKRLELVFDEAITKGLEGIMAKKMTGTYRPGAREWNWIKLKRSYSSKINDTIDCLVMGYDQGKGKRADFGIGAFLAGVYDPQQEKFLTVAKIGTGLSDDEWRTLKKLCDEHKSPQQPKEYEVDKINGVDVWVSPSIVVEIKADEISRSAVHTAGRVMKPTKSGGGMEVEVAGFALRFPRLEKFRDDKSASEVTTVSEVESMFKKQGAQ